MRAGASRACCATTFRPEFLNRVDETVIFRRLTAGADPPRSSTCSCAASRARLAERKIALEVTDEARDLLGREGYDPAFGARPLKRVVQRRLENPLALAILEGRISDGERVVVDADGEELSFAAAPVQPVALEA